MKNNRFLFTTFIYGIAILLLMGIRVAASLGVFENLSDQAAEVVASVLTQVVIMLGIPLLMLLLIPRVKHETISIKQINQDIGWRKLSFKNVILCFVLGICLYLFNLFVANIFSILLQSLGYQNKFYSSENVFMGYNGLLLAILLSAVLPGICEEFLHRGVLMGGLIKQFGVRRAVLFSSILFGLMHMNVGQFFYASILGWFMGMTVLASGSLWGSMIVHFTNNALATYFGYAKDLYIPGTKLLTYITSNSITLLLTILIVFIVIGEILRYMARDKFNRNLDSYTVRYLASQNHFNVEDFDRLKSALPTVLRTMPTWKATAAYVETFDQPQRTKTLERALFVAIYAMGIAVTILSFVWGTW